MPNLEGRKHDNAPSGSPAWTRARAFERASHAESAAAYYRESGDEEIARAFDQAAQREIPRLSAIGEERSQ